jgi:hypothetical protein
MTIHPQDVHTLRAQIAGWLAVEPEPHIGDALVAGMRRLSGELVPVPAPPAPVPRRQRKRSLATVLAAARKAGADRVTVDGAVIALSPAAAVPESVSLTDSTGNEWDVVLPEDEHGPH